MLQIHVQLTDQFTTYIVQQGIPAGQHRSYLKWMRYYLYFCHTYHIKQGTDMILSVFLKKINKKKQPAQLQNQEKQFVQLFFCMYSILEKNRGGDWTRVFTELTNAIRVRHYIRDST